MSSENFLDALLGLPEIVGAQASNDGRFIAWAWLGIRETMDVYAVPTDGSSSPFALTESDQNTWLVSWTPDHQAVIVAQDFEGNERAQLFRVDLASPKVLHPLTEANPNYYVRGGNLHPNGHRLIYGANVDKGNEIEPTFLYRHDLQTGERRVLARPQEGHYYAPRLNPQGTHILYTRSDQHPAGQQGWLVDIDGRDDREILNFGADKKVSARWLPDGERVLFTAETETHLRVGIWHLNDASIRWLVDDPSRNIEAAFAPYGSDLVVIISMKDACLKASLLDVHTGEELHLPTAQANLMPIAPVNRAGEWGGLLYSSTQPYDLVRFHPTNPTMYISLSCVWDRTNLKASDLTAAEDFRWKSDDGLEIQGWLYRTPDKAKGTIIYVHGGPTWHSENWINHQIQYLVSQGFNVLDPNYRGSTGFNLQYQNAIKIDGWGGREQDDIRAGIEALIAAGIAEPGKIGITGTSYGGYSSWCAITRLPTSLIAASAPICGMTDLVVDYETTRPDLRPYSEEMMGGKPSDIPERYQERSPIHFVSNIKGKLLIIQGLQDPNVTPQNVRVVEQALDDAGIPYELLTFTDEGHGIERTYNQKALFIQLASFFEKAFAT